MALKNEIGNIYGYLTVIARAENDKDNRAQWLCKCKCGNEVIVRGKSLRSGNTKSCGCYQKERAAQSNMDRVGNLVGQRFGKLQIISEAGFITHTNGKRSRIYNCLCDCGNYCQIQHQYLAFGDTTSCGCIRSKGEFQIEQLLKEHNINFQREYSFENLKDKLSLRFDFAIFNNKNELLGLIEYQGEFHNGNTRCQTKEDIKRQQEHDKRKFEFAKNNNIRLIRIKYDEGIAIDKLL